MNTATSRGNKGRTCTDLHATLLHLPGPSTKQSHIPFRRPACGLTDVHGELIKRYSGLKRRGGIPIGGASALQLMRPDISPPTYELPHEVRR